GHCIQRIHDKIHEDLFDLSAIGLDAPEIGSKIKPHLDILGDQGFEHRVYVFNYRVQVQDFRLQNLLAAVCQELTGNARRLLSRVVNQQEVGAHRMIVAQAPQQDFAAPDNHRQQIIEVMSNAAG